MKRSVEAVTKKRKTRKSVEAVPLSVVKGRQEPKPRKTGEMGAECQHLEERLEVAERNHVAPSE